MAFREELPENCPPSDADKIDDTFQVYRLIRDKPPSDQDFRSQRAGRPEAIFGVSECIARGLSVFSHSEHCINLKRLPKFKRRFVCRVDLDKGAGYIKDTGSNPGHRTWWPFSDFPILDCCTVIDE